MTNIQPLSDRVLLKWVNNDKKITDSGIYLPESAQKERPFLYEVVAVGPGKKDSEISVKIWDQVLCGQYSGDEVKHDDEEYKIVAQEYILAVIK